MDKHILLVESNPYNWNIIKEALEGKYDVTYKKNCEQALELLGESSLNMIMLGSSLPDAEIFSFINSARNSDMYIPVIILTSPMEGKKEVEYLNAGASGFIRKPVEPEVICNSIEKSIELAAYRKNIQKTVDEKMIRMEQRQYMLMRQIVELVEGRDENTAGHVERVCRFVKIILKGLKKKEQYKKLLTDDYCLKTEMAAAIHDIGKIKISDIILNQPRRLTEEEFSSMQLHVQYGGEVLQNLFHEAEDEEYFQIMMDIVSYHHEKWDGTGYLFGISGEEIPLPARIAAIADVFDALITRRCYKEPIDIEEAFDIIESGSGKDFDPVIVEAFLSMRLEVKYVLEELT